MNFHCKRKAGYSLVFSIRCRLRFVVKEFRLALLEGLDLSATFTNGAGVALLVPLLHHRIPELHTWFDSLIIVGRVSVEMNTYSQMETVAEAAQHLVRIVLPELVRVVSVRDKW